MLKILSKLKSFFTGSGKKVESAPLLNDEEAARLRSAIEDKPTVVVIKPQPRGRVIKETRPAEYNPRTGHKGGRIVKAMPKQLRQMKAAQEKVEDDGDTPRVEDLSE